MEPNSYSAITQFLLIYNLFFSTKYGSLYCITICNIKKWFCTVIHAMILHPFHVLTYSLNWKDTVL